MLNKTQVTLGFDGWVRAGRKYINVLLLYPNSASYWTTIVEGNSAETAQNTNEWIDPIIKGLLNKGMRVVAIICDNTSNVTAAATRLARENGLIQIGCSSHQIQLIVNDVFKIPSIKAILNLFDGVINTFRDVREYRLALEEHTRSEEHTSEL